MAISMAANLREAFSTSELLQSGYQRALVLTDTPVMLVPMDEFQEDDFETLYHACFTGYDGYIISYSIVPSLNTVAVFAVNKDLKTVVTDHFTEARFMPIWQPVWEHLQHRRRDAADARQLFAYFHDQRMEVISFQQNRFKFYNTYDAQHAHDALYFLLYAWKQLGFDALKDELHLVGEPTNRSWLTEKLHQYLTRIVAIKPATDFNIPPAEIPEGVTYDLLTLNHA